MTKDLVMLAKRLTPEKLRKLIGQESVLYIQPKLNGIRAYWDGETLVSRTGKMKFTVSCMYIIDELRRRNLPPGLDGEIYVHGMSLPEISGKVRQQKEPCPDLHFYVYDIISKQSFGKRYQGLVDSEIHGGKIYLVRTDDTQHITYPENFVKLKYKEFLERGYEGLILRADKPYCFGRKEGYLYKMKPEHDMDLVLVGFNPATTDMHKDTFGSLQLRHPTEGWEVACSGLTEAMRKELWRKRDELIGATIEIKYEELSPEGKPQRLKFSRVRWDK